LEEADPRLSPDGVGFPGPSLAVCEDSGIVAIKEAIHEGGHAVVKQLGTGEAAVAVNLIEGEGVEGVPSHSHRCRNIACAVYGEAGFTALLRLTLEERPDVGNNTDWYLCSACCLGARHRHGAVAARRRG